MAESGQRVTGLKRIRSIRDSPPGLTDSSSVVVMDRTTATRQHWASKYSTWWSPSTLVFTAGLLLLTFWKPASGTLHDLNSGFHEYCWNTPFQARCPDGQVIYMTSARYYGIGCGNDVTDIYHRKCSGRRTCYVRCFVDSLVTCPENVLLHLQTGYDCLIGVTGTDDECRLHGEVKLTPTSGYISSELKVNCPFSIKAKEGQQIRFALLDYTDLDSQWDPSYICREYASITETGGHFRNFVRCRKEHKAEEVYVSRGNEVKIELKLTSTSDYPAFYLLRYQVFGCVLPVIQPGMYIVEKTNTLTHVRCNDTDDEWVLWCQENVLRGSLGNCSSGENRKQQSSGVGLVFKVVIICVVVAVVGVVAALTVALIYSQYRVQQLKEKNKKSQNMVLMYQLGVSKSGGTVVNPNRTQGPEDDYVEPISHHEGFHLEQQPMTKDCGYIIPADPRMVSGYYEDISVTPSKPRISGDYEKPAVYENPDGSSVRMPNEAEEAEGTFPGKVCKQVKKLRPF